MKKPLAALAAVGAASIALAPAAQANHTPNTVSRGEFNQARPGMTAVDVTILFDVPGKMISQGDGYQTRRFLGWRSGDGQRYRVEVTFRIGNDERWHLSSKRAYLPE